MRDIRQASWEVIILIPLFILMLWGMLIVVQTPESNTIVVEQPIPTASVVAGEK